MTETPTAAMPVARLYTDAQRSFVDLLGTLAPDEFAAPVPTCPQWTVRDVVAHVAGVVDDTFNGRMDGAATDPWTAAQVARSQDVPVARIIERWSGQTPEFAALLQSIGEGRPIFDCVAHEHDVRTAVGRPGDRTSAVIEMAAELLVQSTATDHDLRVVLDDGRVWHHDGDGEPITLRGVTPFELFRSRLGRRSRAQVMAYDWSADPSAVVEGWFTFGPSAHDIHE